ncbi:ABC superfamily ATP binding cassette transporter [Sporosarcina newyorkensis 2681]|uniref:ABC superfamily ATP binding cassette transporter n=1 Tax=Sporosarcina newyorkensis 2681 TaxID=1027292 RepID=F9DQY6_9BACL|nr:MULTISPECIES: ABC transporter permease [Sporosarcina]EGQ26784.1 ABC superfamily ATP binding cassette transporter [Sporosarcina newyorkensis 2681]MBY0221641.1 ABC transporter permease [Sporosarcina aquimarina]
MNESGLTIKDIIKEEWMNIFKDRRLLAMLVFVPVLYSAMFAYLYSNHTVKEMDTVLFDQDNSQLSRQIVQSFDQSESFNVTNLVYSESEIEQAIASGEAKVGVIIPSDFSARLNHGESPSVLTMIDGSNMMISNLATRSANEIVSTIGTGASVEQLQQQGFRSEEISKVFSPIPFSYRVLYNPTFDYSVFLVYGLIGTALQQVLLLGIALTVARDKELGIWGRFTGWKEQPWKIAYAKCAPYFLIGVLNTFVAYLVGMYVVQLPFRGDILPFFILTISFAFALLGLGYLVSLFSESQLASTQLAMLIAVPSFLLSGFTWPFAAMPSLLSTIGHMLPLTYFLDGVREIFLKGNGFITIWRDIVALLLMGLVTFFIAIGVTSLNRYWHKKESAEKGTLANTDTI